MSYEGLVQELREYAKNGNKFLNGWSLYLRAAAAIEILDRLCDRYEAELDRVTAERDAAVNDLRDCAVEDYAECMYCSHREKDTLCWNCMNGSNWEWRGVER